MQSWWYIQLSIFFYQNSFTVTLLRQPIKTLSVFYHVIIQAYPQLMGSLCVKFHDCMCKGKEIAYQLPFSVIYTF